jgi:MinD-like ATPase involved in chromosome partitioning or flagellar assembly
MEQTLLFLASFSSLIIIITPKTPHSFTPTSYYKMSNNNNNEKEREKAKQKNIAVIENAIAARNKVLMLLLLCSFLFVYLNKSSHFSKINFSLFSAFASRY